MTFNTRYLKIFFGLGSLLAVAACSDLQPAGTPAPLPPAPTTVFYTGYGVTPTQSQIDAVRNNSQFKGIDGIIGRPAELKNYALMGIDYAHAAGLKGSGQTIAVVDNGFERTHVLLGANGRTVTFFDNPDTATHGTAVASVAAGSQGTAAPMHGVAPLANLFLADWNGGMAGIATKFLAAKAAGAIVVNNSWGPTSIYSGEEITTDEVQAFINGGQTLEQALQSASGWTNWDQFLSASRSFGQTGIVVVAASNNQAGKFNYSAGASKSELLSSLPLLSADLADAWLKVISFQYDVGLNGQNQNIVTNRYLASEPCGAMAKECLSLPSQSIVAPYSGGYPTISGTSFGAPMVSGMIALLAEAFPSLSAVNLKERLLASADNSYFAAGEVIGTETFANAFAHDYSDKWGHGTPDVGAALRPIGTVSIVKGENLATAERIGVEQSGLVLSTPFGGEQTEKLRNTKIAVFDDLNGNFDIKLGDLVADADGDAMTRKAFSKLTNRELGAASLSWSASVGFGNATAIGVGFSDGQNENAPNEIGQFGFARGFDGPLSLNEQSSRPDVFKDAYSLLGLNGETAMAFADQPIGGETVLRTFGFMSNSVLDQTDVNFGAGALLSHQFNAETELRFGATLFAEANSFAGITGGGAFENDTQNLFQLAEVGFKRSLGERVQLFANYEYAWALDDGFGAQGIVSMSGAQLSGYEFGLTASDVLLGRDTLTLAVSAPLAFSAGTMNMTLPVGRTANGDILYDEFATSLGVNNRQIDVGATYVFAPSDSLSYSLAGQYSFNAGHLAGNRDFRVMAGFQSNY